MGYNAVAVIYTDHMEWLPSRMQDAIRSVTAHGKNVKYLDAHFSHGMIVSCEHADYEQVVVVSRNSGVLLRNATEKDVGYMAEYQMAEFLRSRGYKVTEPDG